MNNDPQPDRVVEAAIRLHDFIRSNAGETSDWPLRITSTESGAIEKLDALLREFREAANAPDQARLSDPNQRNNNE